MSTDDIFAIDSPCNADWDTMPGDDTTRHCGECDQSVTDLSMMTREEATALVVTTDSEGRPPCAQYGLTDTGQIIFQPQLIRPERRFGRLLAVAALAVTGVSLAAASADVEGEAVIQDRLEETLPGAGSVSAADPMLLLQAAVNDAVANVQPDVMREMEAVKEAEARRAVEELVNQAAERAAQALRQASDAMIRARIRKTTTPLRVEKGGMRGPAVRY